MPAEEQKLNVLYQLGQEIKERREKIGLTLEELHETTHIRADFLESIEAGDYRNLPDTVYTLGFIRTYLKVLNLDEMYPEFAHWLKKGTRITERKKEVFGQYSPPPPGFKLASRFWIFVVLILIIVGFVIYVAYSWGTHGAPDISSRATVNEPRTPISIDEKEAERVVKPPISQDKVSSEPALPIPVVEVQNPEKPELKIFALEDCWISVRIGDKNDQFTLKKGTSYSAALTDVARVTYGRPWVVKVTLNGKDIGSPYTGGTRRTQVNYYSPDGRHGRNEPSPR